MRCLASLRSALEVITWLLAATILHCPHPQPQRLDSLRSRFALAAILIRSPICFSP
jgi:hypothetical protein